MYGDNPRSTAQIGGHPVHPMLVPFPITCLVGALVTDLIFLASGDRGFATASHWLIGFGIGTALLAAAFGLIDFMGDDRIRRLGHALQHMMANVAAVVVAVINFIIRLDDPAGQIGSMGVFLSLATVLILMFSGWRGADLVYHHKVGVHDHGTDGARPPSGAGSNPGGPRP